MRLQGEFWVTDIHSHILPGLDDGAGSWEQAEEMLRIARKEGIQNIVVTPHFMPGHKNPPKEKILEQLTILQEIGDKQGYGIRLYPGNEIYYHEEVPDLLEEGRIFPLAGSEYVLVEFSPMDDYRYIRNALAEIQTVGFLPIVAHVERYESLCSKPFDKLAELRDMGALLQVNMASIEGKTGRKCQKLVFSMLKKQLVDFLGTDAHSAGNRAPYTCGCIEILCRKCPADYVERLLYKNAEGILWNAEGILSIPKQENE